MILPTKHIRSEESLIGVGAYLLSHLSEQLTVSSLWERVKGNSSIATYERFILALDLLFSLGAIELERGLIRRQIK